VTQLTRSKTGFVTQPSPASTIERIGHQGLSTFKFFNSSKRKSPISILTWSTLDCCYHAARSCLLKFRRIVRLAPRSSMAAMATPWMCFTGCSKATSPAIPSCLQRAWLQLFEGHWPKWQAWPAQVRRHFRFAATPEAVNGMSNNNQQQQQRLEEQLAK
jgi:hypothetical protein